MAVLRNHFQPEIPAFFNYKLKTKSQRRDDKKDSYAASTETYFLGFFNKKYEINMFLKSRFWYGK